MISHSLLEKQFLNKSFDLSKFALKLSRSLQFVLKESSHSVNYCAKIKVKVLELRTKIGFRQSVSNLVFPRLKCIFVKCAHLFFMLLLKLKFCTKNVMTLNPLFALLNVFCHQSKPRFFLFFDKSKLPFINQTWFLTFLVTLLFSYKNYKFKLAIFYTIIVLWDYLESALSYVFPLK